MVRSSNGALSRAVPPLTWPVDWYYSGGPMLTLTVTAAGNSSVLCTERPSVQAGTEYLASDQTGRSLDHHTGPVTSRGARP